MPKFLFWNLNGNDVSGLLSRMAREELIDVSILAELLRPDLLKGFAPEQVRIVTEIGCVSLPEGGRPDKTVASDHLPVVVGLDF